MDSDSEPKLISLITQLLVLYRSTAYHTHLEWKSLFMRLISLVRSMDMESQPKPESKLMSLVKQTISVFHSMDLDSQPKPLLKLISCITQLVNSIDSDPGLKSLIRRSFFLKPEPEPELMSLIRQIFCLVIPMNPKWGKRVSLCPQVQVKLLKGEFHVNGEIKGTNDNKWACLISDWDKFNFKGEEATHFLCRGCNGKNHKEEYEQAPLKVKHPLHPKHTLLLVLVNIFQSSTKRKCYCCDEELEDVFYYCSFCDFAMNIACVEKKLPVLSKDHPKWHEHTLSLFPRYASLTCDLCALADSSCPFYICPPCDFVAHQTCLSLPRVIRISRHHHRISFTPSFDRGEDWSCGVCRKKMDNDYGGYSCIGCSYAAHSRCATQRNVWDGIDLEGTAEEDEQVLEPFVRISDEIIQHFTHQQHHLRLDENTGRDYDDNKQCQVCITPSYFDNLYSCVECDFVLHEACANLSRKIYHPIHRHMLTLVGASDGNMECDKDECSACGLLCANGFFYECRKEECRYRSFELRGFKIHVQCAKIPEPLVHQVSHKHHLFLTSKPGEWRTCGVCYSYSKKETFNCIEGECDFALCFKCAIIPQKVRYKHDKHILTLSSEEMTSSTMTSWCEACEGKIYKKKWFYKCDEYCCVTLHIDCLIGKDLYMKPGSTWIYRGRKADVLPNNHHRSRPICSYCKKRCPHKIVFQRSGLIYCSVSCNA